MNINNIPAELKGLKQWAVFRSYLDKESGKYKKVIISTVTGKFAKSNEPETWEEFNKAEYYRKRYRYQGLTFALDKGIIFIDIDHAIDKESGQIISEEAKRLLKLLPDTYAETSVSGTGIHILCKGSLPNDAMKRNDEKGIEIYNTRRFICMTGDLIDGRGEIKDYSDSIADIAYTFTGRRPPPREYISVESRASDAELIEEIRRSRQGGKFDALLRHICLSVAFACRFRACVYLSMVDAKPFTNRQYIPLFRLVSRQMGFTARADDLRRTYD